MLNAALPGTVVCLAATILLVLVTVSVPITKSFDFLSADLSGSAAGKTLAGQLKLGTFGYCLQITGGKDTCTSATLGYSIDAASLLGFSNSKIEQAVNLDGISSSVIKGLSYVLVLHPIAAGLAGAATISGVVQHIREFSSTMVTGWLASVATTLAVLAFIFDIIVFSIAKSRINSNNDGQVNTAASLGNAIWMTLAAALLLAFSGCFFCCGRRVLNRRRRGQSEADRMRPMGDDSYNDRMRRDAEYAEKRRAEEAGRRKDSSSLPAFAEFGHEEARHEAIPLKEMENEEEDDRYSDGDHHDLLANHPGRGSEAVAGVGVGYGRRTGSERPTSPSSSIVQRPLSPPRRGGTQPRPGQGPVDPYANLPSHVERGADYMSPPPAAPLDDDHPLSPSSPSHHGTDYRATSPTGFPMPAPAPPGHMYPTYAAQQPSAMPMPGSFGQQPTSSSYHDPYGGVSSPLSSTHQHRPFDLPMPGQQQDRPASPQSYAPTYATMPLPGHQQQSAEMEQRPSQWTGYGGPPSYRGPSY